MNKDRKMLFFDIDGTLIDFNNKLSESALPALAKARAGGNEIFLATGRSRCQIDERLEAFGFDGMITATGAHIEYKNNVINTHYIPAKELGKIVGFFEEEKIPYIMQCTEHMIFAPFCKDKIHELFGENYVKIINSTQKLEDIMAMEEILPNLTKYRTAEKFCYYDAPFSIEEVEKILSPEFTVEEMSFGNRGMSSGEVTMAGITKSYGIQKLMERTGVQIENVIAFGDGANDKDMIEFAGVGVVMGNSSENLKKIGDMVTASIEKDGVPKALIKLGIIEA